MFTYIIYITLRFHSSILRSFLFWATVFSNSTVPTNLLTQIKGQKNPVLLFGGKWGPLFFFAPSAGRWMINMEVIMAEEGRDAMGLLSLMIGLTEYCNGLGYQGWWFTRLPLVFMPLRFCIFIAQWKGKEWPCSKLPFNRECGWCHGGVYWQNDEWRSQREKLNAISYHKPKSWNFKMILTAVVPRNRTPELSFIRCPRSNTHEAVISHFKKGYNVLHVVFWWANKVKGSLRGGKVGK